MLVQAPKSTHSGPNAVGKGATYASTMGTIVSARAQHFGGDWEKRAQNRDQFCRVVNRQYDWICQTVSQTEYSETSCYDFRVLAFTCSE